MSEAALFEQIRFSTAAGPFYKADSAAPPTPVDPQVRLIAFYLPQFHPIPENDAWWGRGFTEWTNVTKAVPRFAGHVQPRLPGDFGFYDLRDPKVLQGQAKLARRYGVAGFCFHHFWFNGRRLLEKPLEMLLRDPGIDMPFCVNWANENWTRRWDGHDNDILLGQNYSPEDDVAFAESLVPIVQDPRYIRIGGRPLVMIYRPGLLPEPLATMRRWRTVFARAGQDNPYIVMAQGFGDADPRLFGIDAAVEFPPHKVAVTPHINQRLQILDADFQGSVLDYADVAHHAASLGSPSYKLFRCVTPSWDNEARRPGRGLTLAHSTPAKYGAWLDAACRITMAEKPDAEERIVFINAWNEWAEGAYLEPDRHFGYAYLAETARVLSRLDRDMPDRGGDRRRKVALLAHDARLNGAQMLALALARTVVADHNVGLTILLGGPGPLTPEFAALAPTETVPGEFADQAAWRDVARRLVAAGVTAVISNTLVSARAIAPLRDAGLRIVQLVHELPTLIQQFGLDRAARDAAAHAAVLVFSSAYARDCFAALYEPIGGEVVVRPQGLYMPRLDAGEREQKRAARRAALGIDARARVVLGVGYGEVRKGLDLWPALVRRVAETCPDVVFLWAGNIEPSLRHWLEHDLRATGHAERVLLPGHATDIAGLYAAADLFVLTSREDPFPSVVLEAMANGLPTVVFEGSGGIVDLVRDAGGVCVPYLDVDAMGREIARILRDPETAGRMGTTASRRMARDFDYRDYARALLELALPLPFTVSVVVPNYNYARYLRDRLESIWRQGSLVGEVIVLDDASTDGSDAVIAELAKESPFPIRVVRNAVNSGSISRQWARGVSLARFDLVWIAEADDVADPGFLAAVVPAFADETVVVSYSQSRMIDEAGNVSGPDYLAYVSDIDPLRWTADFWADGAEEIARSLSVKNTIPNVSAVVFRREAIAAVLRDHLEAMAGLRNAADWLCYLRLLCDGGALSFVAKPLNSHRRHAGSVTIAAFDRGHFQEIVAMQELAAALVSIPPDMRRKALDFRTAVARQFGVELEDIACVP
jgi:hypothetical protein